MPIWFWLIFFTGDIIDNFFIIDFEVAELKQLLRKQVTKGMAIWVVRFPWVGYKDRSSFGQKSTYSLLYFSDRIVVPSCQKVNKAWNLWFLFPLALIFLLLKWKHHYFTENIIIFYSNDDFFFTQYLFLNEKRCHLMTLSWQLESERKK